MRIIAGLGNPGVQYAFTRHNMGWQSIDYLVNNNNLGKANHKFNAECWRMSDVVLMKPLTYMNSSGVSISEAVNFYKIDLSDLLIIYDDMSLPFGKLRMRAQGSAGGHNGLKSIISALGSMNIPRLRIGIGQAQDSMINYVLGHLEHDELDRLPEILKRVETIKDYGAHSFFPVFGGKL